jgi:hypothetical protein
MISDNANGSTCGADRGDLRIGEYPQMAGQLAVEAIERLAGLQNRADRQ